MTGAKYDVYWAGGLFKHGELAGNALLAAAVDKKSGGKYSCVLPQNIEGRKTHPKDIRDSDIAALIKCDLALFNYDGCELDSGTVVEFMLAKFADIPSVLLRTDFRGGGDCGGASEYLPWNLMTSFYPRTRVLVADSAKIYEENGRDITAATDAIASLIVSELDSVLSEKPRLPASLRDPVYKWIAEMPGFSSNLTEEIMEALESKLSKKLL